MAFELLLSEEIAYRSDFALLANARGVLDAVEVGTDQGIFARDFLGRFAGNWLICVDPYLPCGEFEYDRMGDLLTAIQALAPYLGRYRLIRERSPQVIPHVLQFIRPPGFVYIDGAHDEASVLADLEAWWEILPAAGILAGHDFDAAHPGVTRAVTRFARERDLVVRLTREPAMPSWYVYRTEPRELMVRLFRDEVTANPRWTA